jgi:ubiquinone/menaquinone biosynthesis C-methylase UbiE
MLKIAHKHLQRDGSPPAARDITDLDNPQLYKDNCFDLLFACAIMVHVPHSEAPEVLRCFYRILRPGGALFVNFKVGDHTLLGLGKEPGRDDRYFEYYRHHSLPWTLLEESGFSIDELALRWNHKNMYHDPKKIHWANFYCTKRSADS